MGLRDLFRSAHFSKDPEVRLKAVGKLTDQQLLSEIAKTDKSIRVRKAAVARVNDQEMLFSIALDGREIDARIDAVERIESQQKLALIIKIRKNYQLMGACFSQISDKKILEEIAANPDYNMSARRIAIENYADESFLIDIDRPETESKPKTPEEIDAYINKYGSVRLARALGKFRGSKSAIFTLGEIMRRGGEASLIALEYLVQGLDHSNPEISGTAEDQLSSIKNPELIAQLVRILDETTPSEKILSVLKRIDHPDARQIIKDRE
ncbi:MAG: hypothetical protein J7K40_01995 [candidate division Zixibacteria bacterium]|nr:hypothetical protein [candidate division Zixibacteria bacterium]